mmetsp:Transcript_5347/g.19526  ORF Transcript_5347/g.19526 Transcript_5347/m.19526 type:complete len:89 (+) Transcript_5347:360-626(+)
MMTLMPREKMMESSVEITRGSADGGGSRARAGARRAARSTTSCVADVAHSMPPIAVRAPRTLDMSKSKLAAVASSSVQSPLNIRLTKT